MKKRILAIDFIKGLSIFIMIFLHIILYVEGINDTDYSKIPFLYYLRDLLNFCVVTLVIGSGFSLYKSTKNINFNIKNSIRFYKKRLLRLIIPWKIYIIISISVYFLIKIISNNFLNTLKQDYSMLNFMVIKDIPLGWLLIKWIIFLMIFLTISYPILKNLYEKKKNYIPYLIIIYLISVILSLENPLSFFYTLHKNNHYDFFTLFPNIITFILGWSLLYLFSFYIEELYSNDLLLKNLKKLTFLSILSTTFFFLFIKTNNFDIRVTFNEFPPNPYFFSLGISITFILLNCYHTIEKFLIKSKILQLIQFYSKHSLWIYLWSLQIYLFIGYLFSRFININIYLRLITEFTITCIILTLIILSQESIKNKFFKKSKYINKKQILNKKQISLKQPITSENNLIE